MGIEENKPAMNVKLRYALILIVPFVLALVISKSNLFNNPYQIHTILELINIFINASIFMVIWYTYERSTPINHFAGFGFLMVTIFNIAHAITSLNQVYFDFSERLESIETLIGVLVLIIISKRRIGPSLNKNVIFVVTLALSAALIYLVYITRNLISAEIFEILRYVTITCFFFGIYSIRKLSNGRKEVIFEYIQFAMFFGVVAEICEIYFDAKAPYSTAGAVIQLFYYYYLLKGIFANTIIYPYEKLAVANDSQEKTNNYMRQILNSLYIGILTYGKDGRLTFANKKAQQILGYSYKELVGLEPEEMTARFIEQEKQHILTSRAANSDNPFKDKIVRIRNRSGALIPIRSDVQEVENGFIHIFHDAKQEQELQNLQLQTETILNSITNFVLVTDTDKNIIMCNKAFGELAELPPEEIIGQNLDEFNEFIHYTRKDGVNKVDDREKNMVYESSIVTPSGKKKDMIINRGPIINLEGEIIGVISTGLDITEMKSDQEKIKQQEKLAVLGEMTAGIVHEIRNPLTTIKGFAQLMIPKLQDTAIKEFATTIEKEVDNINFIVSDFLTFSKPQYPVLKQISINTLVESIHLLVETKSFLEGIEMEMNLSAEEKEVIADEFQLKQVILNIIKNAIEAMEGCKNPKLVIATGLNDIKSQMQVRITDNGRGMAAEDKVKVGTPFFTTKANGTGLGLSICKQILNDHDGSLEIESEPNKGTTVIISLPCVLTKEDLLTIDAEKN